MDLYVDLSTRSARSLRLRLEDALREAIRDGRLAPGLRLPATRSLCVELGVSRGVVVDAYAQLAAEGYLQTRRGGGTSVAASARGDSPRPDARAPTEAIRHDMSPFRPALDGFPRAAWAAALTRVLRELPDQRLGYPDPAGTRELRATLAAYLGRVRAVRARPELVVVTSGTRQGAELLWSALAAAGAQALAVEEPGWPGMRETASAVGLQVFTVPVDDDGLCVEQLERVDVDAVALAPAHQYPTGAVLSAARRTALIAWARRRDAVIFEDDYDAEYRYDRQPIGSLQGLAPDHVVYGGSVSKTLAPAVRLGWLVLPPRFLGAVRARQRLRGSMPAPLEQLALADLIERGELDRHLRRQRRRYARRREALLDALRVALPGARVRGAAAGLYVVLHLPAGLDEQDVLVAARSRGVALEGLGGAPAALVLGYANLPEDAVAVAVEALAQSVVEAGSCASANAARQCSEQK